jgi:peroxiredoxin
VSQAPETADAQTAGGYLAAFDQVFRLHEQGLSFSGREPNCAFLNLGGADFSDFSAGSGLDFPDDGRALAVVDWDQDGDLDLWFANRTAPHLRFLRNGVADPAATSVQLRLQGTRGNRDAIGARAVLELAAPSGSSRRLARTLRAGDGFLSQSSKWLHFGLGADAPAQVRSLTVRWPDGSNEVIAGVDGPGRYEILEGSGRATRAGPARRSLELAPSTLEPPAPETPERVVLTARPPAPPLEYRSYDGKVEPVNLTPGGPLLLNLWATWCMPCVRELEDFTARADDIRNTGLRILALSVDALDPSRSTAPGDAQRFLTDRSFPHPSGMASQEVVSRLQILHDRLFSRRIELAVPTSFLFDRLGRLAAIYRGALDLERLLEDVRNLEAPVRMRRLVASPFPGRWLTEPQELRLGAFARRFAEEGLPDVAAYYLELELEAAPDDTELRALLATQLAAAGRTAEAIKEFRRALAEDPDLEWARARLEALEASVGSP